MAATVKPNTEYVLSYDGFSGGLNIRDMEYSLPVGESPDMKNLLWRNGLLASRKGQRYLNSASSRGTGRATYSALWHGYIFAHIGTKLWTFDAQTGTASQLATAIPAVRGTFFMYGGSLFYKTKGAYKKITAVSSGGAWSFTAANVTPYDPVIVINAAPGTGSGDLYQPENRLSPRKTVWFNAVQGVTEYYLPVIPESITKVVVDGVELTTGWSFNVSHGSVVFTTPPPVTNPPTNNTVRITYSLTNAEAYDSVNTCRYAEVYGGTGALCVVLAGCETQPNAYFWSGNSNIAMDPGYFPMEQYQIAGEANDPITGFGKQQNYLVIFQEHQIGKATLGTTLTGEDEQSAGEVARSSIDMPYIPINAAIGCPYPWSIQLVQNNLVWAGAQGIYVLLDTSEANENTVRCLSGKINGTPPSASAGTKKKSLLFHLGEADPDTVCSADDGHRYYITCDGVTYCWDYDLSAIKDPAWFFLTQTNFLATVYDSNELYFLDANGRVLALQEAFNDFGQPFERYYRTGSQDFGDQDRRKNINSVIVALGADYESDTTLTYITEYEERNDLTNLQVIPQNEYDEDREPGTRPLSDRRPAVFRRRPMCRRVQYFSLRLRNANLNEDLALSSIRVFFTKQGRLR